jgi:hypothetical protein
MPHGARHGARFDLLPPGPYVALLIGGERRTPRDPQAFRGEQDEQRQRDQLRTPNDDVLSKFLEHAVTWENWP